MEMFDSFSSDTVRDSFGKSLCEIACMNDRVISISADSIGASKTNCFSEKYPQRAFNVGIAEQSMVSFAAGMALEGYIPYVSTRAPFLSMRSAEQVRTAVCYDNLHIVFVGTGAGYCSGTAGSTHWALEDVAIMSSMGNMTVFETGDRVLIKKIIEKTLTWEHPTYIRLGKDTEKVIYDENEEVELGKAKMLIEGKDGYFIVSGTIVNYALEAANILREKYGMNVGVIDMYTIKPLDSEAICMAAKTGRIIVAQDHNVIGGLGSMVAMEIARKKIICKYHVLGCPDYFVPVSTADYLYNKFELDSQGLVRNMIHL